MRRQAISQRNDPYHDWAVGLMKQICPPMRTCEAVLSEVERFFIPKLESGESINTDFAQDHTTSAFPEAALICD